MIATPKTIQIYLPGGNPRGIRIAEVTTRIVQVIEVPRSLLGEFLSMPEAKQVGVYYLVGSGEDDDSRLYIGQTGDLRMRLADHNRKKDFWERALVLISRTNSLTQTHATFLEWLSIQQVRRAGRYADENGNAGTQPFTPAPMEADCHEIFDTGATLLSTLGFPMFSAAVDAARDDGEVAYRVVSSGANARGKYTPEGFVVFKGSIGRRKNTPSLNKSSHATFRDRLLESGVMRADGETIVFEQDYLFKSPSMAAVAVLGRHANGWAEWKADDGRTLSDIERGETEGEG